MLKPLTTTGIGSLPHTDPEEACRLVFDTFDIPFWPQLPRLSFHELMIPQFSEDMPFLRIDEQKEQIWIDQGSGSNDLALFYENYSENWQAAISENYARGFHAFVRVTRSRRFHALKGQITGPLTFSLGLKDAEGRPIYFDEELREISLMLLKSKIRWQIETLKPYADKIVFCIDEPILSALGSTIYIGVDPDEALRLLKESADTIKHSGGIPAIHCCGKADWPLVIRSGTDIISFDAYSYIETILLYPSEFTEFLKRGKYLAWGIVPTTESIRDENVDSLTKRFHKGMDLLSKSVPSDLLLSHILLTPSCGTGSMSKNEALRVFQLLRGLKEALLK